MRQFIWSFLVLIFSVTLLSGTKSINAQYEGAVNMIEGASIRKKTDTSSQGLRFYASLDESFLDNEHGFYLVYGKTTVATLEEAINNSTLIINGKEVFKTEVKGVTRENTYSVVLVGIPEAGYFDNISVFPYIVIDGEIIINHPEIRSIANIAFKMANEGENINDIVSVDYIMNTNRKLVNVKPNGDIEILKGIYELDYNNLREEFVKDWNKKFNHFIDGHIHEEFYYAAKEGSNDENTANKDLANTNIYKFFNDSRLSTKWGWLLDYIIEHCDIVLPSMQAEAVKGSGTYGNNLLFNAYHLSYSIINFLNQESVQGEYTAIDFTDVNKYANLKDFNNQVYVNLNNGKLYLSGEEIYLPQPMNRHCYNFQHYLRGTEQLGAGHPYVIGDDEVIKAVYSPIQYALRFYDGDNLLNHLSRTYNIEDDFVLPEPTKEGSVFLGWYLDASLEGEQVIKIEQGSFGEVELYASWRAETLYTITYHLNGGVQPAGSIPTEFSIVSEDITLPIPTRSGYEFSGWYDNPSLSGSAITQVKKGSVNNKNFYAKWIELGPSDQDLVLDAKNNLAVGLASGDTLTAVTKNVSLPTSGDNGVTITWSTSNSAAISNSGVVTRGNNNVTVTLTATLKLNAVVETKVFTLTVLKVEQVDPNQEYTITFNLNGGAWPTTGGTPGYTNRTTMVTDFLTDFYNFLKPAGVSVTDFIHGPGKTSGFDGMYGLYNGETVHFDRLYDVNKKGVDANSDKFINQPEYNKWVPLIDVLEEYTNLGFDNEGVQQTFWGSTWTGARRIVPFMQAKNLWGSAVDDNDVATITSTIPEALKSSTPGVAVEVPTKYTPVTEDIILPNPEKTNDQFIGWYDNINLWGDKITKIEKGSSGNKTFYARYNSSVVTDPSLTDADKLALAKAEIKITYASGDNKDSVTKNITLPKTGIHGATITWSSSDTSTINGSGNVIRKETDTIVTLTATIKVGSLTETLEFKVTVIKKEPEPTHYTITFNLNGGKFVTTGYKNKTELATGFLTDLYKFVAPSENLTTFMHGAGKTSGFDGTWYSNEEHRAKIFKANTKTGDNGYFLSSGTYQAKWKPMADFMVNFVKVGNPDQDYWASPYTGNLRMKQYFTNVKPSTAWSDEEMAKMPTGLSATQIPDKYDVNTPTITLPAVTRSGYEFAGWYTTATFTGTKVTTIPKGSTGNKVFYAKWDQPSSFTITYHLNGGAFSGYTSKTTLANDFLTDLHSFIKPSENLTTFMHGAGKTSGFAGTWYSNEEYRAKIYLANVKSGNNNYFLSHSSYQAKWKPMADFMVNFVKVGNPDQDYWASPYTGNLRMYQYFTNVKPGSAWTDADMAKLPTGLAASVYYEYNANSPAITLPNPVRSGFTFEGWYTANTGGTKVTSIPAGSTGNKVFYARWKEVAEQGLIDLMNLLKGGHKANLYKQSITYYGASTASRTQYQLVNRFLFEKLSINSSSYWLPTSRSNHPNYTATKHWVVIHDTGNINASAAGNASYMVTTSSASWHYTTGNDGIFQSMDERMVAWHAGDGTSYSVFHDTGIAATNPYARPKMTIVNGNYAINGTRTGIRAPGTASQLPVTGLHPVIINGKYHINDTQVRKSQTWAGSIGFDGGNVNGIGIETSVRSTDHLWWTWAKTSKLTADILVRRSLLPDRVVFHNTFDGKTCPQTAIRSGNINEWLQMIYLEYKVRRYYSNYQITFTSHSSILNSVGRITSLPSADTNVSYTITIKSPSGVTMSERLTTTVRK